MKQWAEVLSPWTGTGDELDSNRPVIGDVYTLHKWEDVTGQAAENLHPEPNYEQVRIEADDTVMAEIEADSDFVIVLGPEDIPEEPI